MAGYISQEKMLVLVEDLSDLNVESKAPKEFIVQDIEKPVRIGRHVTADICFSNSTSVSSNHAEIKFDKQTEKFYITDIKSTNGTFILVEEMPIEEKMQFQAGKSIITVEDIQPNKTQSEIKLLMKIDPIAQNKNVMISSNRQLTIDSIHQTEIQFGKSDQICPILHIPDEDLSQGHGKFIFKNNKAYIARKSQNKIWLKLVPNRPYEINDQTVIRFSCVDTYTCKILPNRIPYADAIDLCQICYSDYTQAKLKPCDHEACVSCITKIQQKNNNCPFCLKKMSDYEKFRL